MKVTIAKSAGFCYGVRRAVEMAEETARKEKNCFMLGPIIHNRVVIERLNALGVTLAEQPEAIPRRKKRKL